MADLENRNRKDSGNHNQEHHNQEHHKENEELRGQEQSREEEHGSESEAFSEEDNPPVFVRERVLGRAETRRNWIRRIVMLIVGAVVFGAVSCVVFVCLKPHAEKWFEKEEPETAIHLPRDEETTEAPTRETPPETEPETETKEDIKEVVESAVESYQWGIADYESLYQALGEIASQANRGIVTVTTITQTMDLFDNPIETEGKASGVIWNISSYEILILTGYQARNNEMAVQVTFCNGSRTEASVKSVDERTGIAIVSVPLASVDQETREKIEVVPLGNSFEARAGQPVVLVGSPKGYVGSFVYGMITYVRSGVPREDMEVRMLYTDVSTDSQATGFVINTKGQIVGMITSKTTGTNTAAIGISDLKSSIERLSNGSRLAYLGIIGQEVTEEISAKKQIPRGVYVAEVVLEGAAYESGLQSGDIVVGIDDTEIRNMNTIESFLEGKVPESVVMVYVQRKGRDGYTKMEIPVKLGAR